MSEAALIVVTSKDDPVDGSLEPNLWALILLNKEQHEEFYGSPCACLVDKVPPVLKSYNHCSKQISILQAP